MPEPLIDSILNLLTSVIGYAAGSNAFYVVFGVALFCAWVIARLSSSVLGSKRGLVASFFALCLPLALALLAYAAVEVYALPKLEQSWAPLYLPWAAFALAFLLTGLLLSRRIWGLGTVLTFCVLIFAALASLGGYYGSSLLTDLLGTGTGRIEERNAQIQDPI